MSGHPGTELVAAADSVEHAGRHHVAQHLGDLERGEGGERRRLENQSVSGQQRRGDLPEGQRERIVPRGDGGHDADGTAHHLDERLGIVLDHLGRSLEVGEVLAPDGGSEDLDVGFGQGLALFGREDGGELACCCE